jgi:hypothetical protein
MDVVSPNLPDVYVRIDDVSRLKIADVVVSRLTRPVFANGINMAFLAYEDQLCQNLGLSGQIPIHATNFKLSRRIA